MGLGVLPWNFRCTGAGVRVVESTHEPTPEAPLTPQERFYITQNFGLPAVPRADTWRLHLRGMVDRDVTLSLAELQALPTVTRELTLECIGNPPGGGLISSAAFTGVRARDALALAGLSPHARGVVYSALDGYGVPLPVSVVEGDGEDSLLVWAINGEALTPDHGSPVRALHRGRHGLFSLKWLDALTAVRTYAPAGALRRVANFVDGSTAVRSKVTVVNEHRPARVGVPCEVRGLAVTPGSGVREVSVLADGRWQRAELSFNTLTDARSPWLWSLWRLAWTPEREGPQLLKVRATATDGATQHEEANFPYDHGAVHALRVAVLR